MFRSKQGVDRHVQELFRTVKDEKERTLRCYHIAKLYFQVEDYETARRYVSCYIEAKGDQPGAHKLLGEIYEALGQKERAYDQFKHSLELEPRQDDLVLRVCELLNDMDVVLDVGNLKYWVDRADEKYPHHPSVFRLKEKVLMLDRPNNNDEDLESLIAGELAARPTDIHLRVKLLKYYTDKGRLEDAYKHATELEATNAHRNSIIWYEALCELLSKCKIIKQSHANFWILHVSALERYAGLSLKEQGHMLKKTIPESAQIVDNFDEAMSEAKKKDLSERNTMIEHMFSHMSGQLHFHLACLVLRKTKREHGCWSEAIRLCGPLLLNAMHTQPIDPMENWALNLDDRAKSQIRVWQREGAYRCSQSGYLLRHFARDDAKRLLEKIDQFCVRSWREKIFHRIFPDKPHTADPYFVNYAGNNPPLRLCSILELKNYDKVAEEVYPSSLHHHVWLGVVNMKISAHNRNANPEEPVPHQYCHVFSDLQLSIFNLSQAAPDSLSQLDVDAFLNAAVLCASVLVEEQQRNSFMSPDRLPTLPADITNSLCSCTQEKWWLSAYKIYRKQYGDMGDASEIRQEIQRGLEVVRCIGNHGLHPAILVHLARIFRYRAKLLKEKDKNHADLPFVEARCELYWTAVIPLLERLLNNQSIRTNTSKMFEYQGREMNNVELTKALDEGRLLLAERYVRKKQYEQAIETLRDLKCPEASFMEAGIHKTLADEVLSGLPKESVTSAVRSQHISLLTEARGCYYLTLDRLRSPGMNPKHPLNAELGTRIADIENDLKRVDPDLWRSERYRNDCDALSEDSPSSDHSEDRQYILENYTGVNVTPGVSMATPPQKSVHRTPKNASTPCRLQRPHESFNVSKKITEARPSPERLDAQIRQLIHSKDSALQMILEQNKSLLEKIDTLQRQFTEFSMKKDSPNDTRQQQQQQQNHRQGGRLSSVGSDNRDDSVYILDDEDYGDPNNLLNAQQRQQHLQQMGNYRETLLAQLQRNSAQMYGPVVAAAAAMQAYYPPAMAYNDPQQMSALYAGVPNPRVIPQKVYCPRSPMIPCGIPKMPENPVQPLFTPRMMNQLGDLSLQPQAQQPQSPVVQQTMGHSQLGAYLQPQIHPQAQMTPPSQLQAQLQSQSQLQAQFQAQSQLQAQLQAQSHLPVQMQHQQQMQPQLQPQSQPILPSQTPALSAHTEIKEIPMTKEIPIVQHLPAKEAPNRQLPVNVVITTSDTLPTNVPSVQPTLSVTIPPQFRAQNSTQNSTPQNPAVPHSYQISMPSHATIPTTVILPPLSTTITNTISATVAEQERIGNKSILSTGHNCSNDSVEVEHDPLPDFIPVIPLPAEVQVTTGEENEESLFCARAKLYRWAEHEWKERGVGNVKLLKNSEAKVRLVMRREQVLKICANHMLTRDMELTTLAGNEKAWIWVANDFADEQLRLEKLCIKFKHVEEAIAFRDAFYEAKASVPVSPVKPVEQENAAKKREEKVSKNEEKDGKLNVAGFSFASKPILKAPESPKSSKKGEETTKPSPFAGFTFSPSSNASVSATNTTPTFSFVKNSAATGGTSGFPAISSSKRVDAISPEKNDPAAISGPINDHGEAVIYENSASLMRCHGDCEQWKNRGLGTAKILLEPKTGMVRLLVKRDETGKLFCNYHFTGGSGAKFDYLKNTDNTIVWQIHETSLFGKSESLGLLFSEAVTAANFLQLVTAIQSKMSNDRIPVGSIRIEGKIARVEAKQAAATKTPLAEMFKPPVDSWECQACYTRNTAANRKCIACEAAKPDNAPIAAEKSVQSVEKSIPSAVKSAPNADKTSWDRFKPQADSWECKSCYIRNSNEKSYCVACDSPKDPSMPPKPKTESSNDNSTDAQSALTFTFGIPPASNETKPKTNLFANPTNLPLPLTFGAPKNTPTSGFSFKMPGDSSEKSAKPIFGGGTLPQTTGNFVFGVTPEKATVNPSSNVQTTGSSFAFGSPGKTFDFKLSSKSPVKSPGGAGDASEDEVAESEDIYFDPVIPLPDKIQVKTGEEDEEIVYSHRAKLFRYDASAKEWKERGIGDIKLLRHKETKKLRLLMRRDQTLKLCLNQMISGDLEMKQKDTKSWVWNAADYSDGDIEYLQVACRFKSPEVANNFKKVLDDALANGASGAEENRAPGSAPASAEIEVTYELKVTPEEREAALKLQLPENFYAYKRNKDCTGCIGCREPEVPIFETKTIVAKIAPPKFTATKTSPTDPAKTVFAPSGASTTPETYIFGPSGQTKNALSTSNFDVENLSICGPKNADETTGAATTFGRIQSPFGTTFGNLGQKTSIFSGTPSAGNSIFGGTAAKSNEVEKTAPGGPRVDNVFGAPATFNVASEPPTAPGSTGNSIFSFDYAKSQTKDSTQTNNTIGTTGNSIFGGSGHTFGTGKFSFGTPSTLMSSATTTTATATTPSVTTTRENLFSVKPSEEKPSQNDKEPETPAFLALESTTTFSSLAAQGTETLFKKDPNFSFADAGASVFGAGAKIQSPAVSTPNKAPAEEEADDETNADDGQDYDPHFEPIIPLPDAIEVRTGEEDEEKLFGQRAKLYRYETETKEWKERGTGEMKVLHHAELGRYRLLLRREQVHKVVCNQLITPDLELHTLHSSDKAWMWAAFNHAEEPFALEELAVKFKSSELAKEFKDCVEMAKIESQKRQALGHSRNEASQNFGDETNPSQADEDEEVEDDEEEAEDDVDEEEDDEDGDEHSMIFISLADLFTLEGQTWKPLGNGVLKILYDSELYGAKIIVEAEVTGEIYSNTVISMETTMEVNENACVWTAIDDVLNPPAKRSLKAVFSTVELARDMYMHLQDGQEYAKQADISEFDYYDPTLQ